MKDYIARIKKLTTDNQNCYKELEVSAEKYNDLYGDL